ncbi:MAG: hypothetical protein R3C20_14005 [Planctomycetaceae bacterium]
MLIPLLSNTLVYRLVGHLNWRVLDRVTFLYDARSLFSDLAGTSFLLPLITTLIVVPVIRRLAKRGLLINVFRPKLMPGFFTTRCAASMFRRIQWLRSQGVTVQATVFGVVSTRLSLPIASFWLSALLESGTSVAAAIGFKVLLADPGWTHRDTDDCHPNVTHIQPPESR